MVPQEVRKGILVQMETADCGRPAAPISKFGELAQRRKSSGWGRRQIVNAFSSVAREEDWV